MKEKFISAGIVSLLIGVGAFLISISGSAAQGEVQAAADFTITVTGRVMLSDGEDEVLVMPRSGGGPNVRIIEPGDI
ncbi:MAG: hypothetical protein WC505_00655 [Patescibacteria group bacterium]